METLQEKLLGMIESKSMLAQSSLLRERLSKEIATLIEKDYVEKEFVEWCLDNGVSKGIINMIDFKPCYDFIKNGHASYYETLDELRDYWQKEVRGK